MSADQSQLDKNVPSICYKQCYKDRKKWVKLKLTMTRPDPAKITDPVPRDPKNMWRFGKLARGQKNGRSPRSSHFPRKVILRIRKLECLDNCLATLLEHRLVMDRQADGWTDGGTQTHSVYYASIASCDKNQHLPSFAGAYISSQQDQHIIQWCW